MVRITGIQADDIDLIWNESIPWVKRALEHNDGEFVIEDIYGFLKKRDMQFWIVTEDILKAIAVTEIINYPQKRVIRVVLLSGEDFDEWGRDLSIVFEKWGQEQGAKGIEVIGRSGWVRKLEKLGYVERHCILKKEI